MAKVQGENPDTLDQEPDEVVDDDDGDVGEEAYEEATEGATAMAGPELRPVMHMDEMGPPAGLMGAPEGMSPPISPRTTRSGLCLSGLPVSGGAIKKRGRPPAKKPASVGLETEMFREMRHFINKQQEEMQQLRFAQDMRDYRGPTQPIHTEEDPLVTELKQQCMAKQHELERLRHSLDVPHHHSEPRERDRYYPKISVSKFTGAEDLDDYLVQFEAVSSLQKWTPEEKAVILLSKLESSALSAVNTCKSKNYEDMVTCLKENFSPEQRELSLQKLQIRKQKKDESFSILAADIQRLALKAYPSVDTVTRDTIATDHFVNAISNTGVRQKLREKHPKDLSNAIKQAHQLLADQETESMLTQRRGDKAHVVVKVKLEWKN